MRIPKDLFISSAFLFASIAISGCVSDATKAGSENLTKAVSAVSEQYRSDLKTLEGRLQTLTEERREGFRILAQSRASGEILAKELLSADKSRTAAILLNQFDERASALLGEEFETEFRARYMAKITPRINALASRREELERQKNAAPNNISIIQERDMAIMRLLALRIQTLEDYRVLRIEYAGRIAQSRANLMTQLTTGSLQASLATPVARDYEKLLKPENLTPPPDFPALSDDVARRRHDIAPYLEAFENLSKAVNTSIQRDGNGMDIIIAGVKGAGAELRSSIISVLPQGLDLVKDYLNKSIKIPEIAEGESVIASAFSTHLKTVLEKLVSDLPVMFSEAVVKMEAKSSDMIPSN